MNRRLSPLFEQKQVFTLCARQNLKIHQLDIEVAYLYGDVVEELYLRVYNPIMRLNKSLYGLKPQEESGTIRFVHKSMTWNSLPSST